jgi:phosphoribosylamine--glycine ligase
MCGLMMTARGPQVLEFNARFGDPETQACWCASTATWWSARSLRSTAGSHETELRWSPGASACVVASSAGYPGSYKTGLPISGLERRRTQVPGVQVFHSGSTAHRPQLVTAGGRVLGVTASPRSLEAALARGLPGHG